MLRPKLGNLQALKLRNWGRQYKIIWWIGGLSWSCKYAMFLPSSKFALQTFRQSCVYKRHKMFVISRIWARYIYEIYGWLGLGDGRTDRSMYLPNTVLIHKCYTGKERDRARDLSLSVYRNPCQQTADWRMSELYKNTNTATAIKNKLHPIVEPSFWLIGQQWLCLDRFQYALFNCP